MRKTLAAALVLVASPASAADVWFNSAPDTDLTGKVIEAMERNVAAANGKPVEFRVNIFAFTEESIADKMLELAKANPNLKIEMVTDWSMLSTSGSHRAPYLEAAAAGDYQDACDGIGGAASVRSACVAKLESLLGGGGLDNIAIHYKKDDPYKWDPQRGVVYDHSATEGLDHHKGIAFLVDGVPTEMLTGSFNWSPTANDSNYENLMRFSRDTPAERELIKAYAAEAGAMFHNAAVSLSGADARIYKTWLYKKKAYEAGQGPNPGPEPQSAVAGGDGAFSICPNPAANPTLEELVASVNGAIAVSGGVFTDDPIAPGGIVAVNHADAKALDALPQIGPATVKKIHSWIEKNGPMESLDDLKAAGLTKRQIDSIKDKIDLRYSEAFFSSKLLDCDKPGTGFAAMNATNTTLVKNDGAPGASRVPGSLPAPAIDLFRRANPGDVIKIAAYGYAPNSPEYQEMKKAVARGARVQVILNKAYNESVVAALGSLAQQYPGMVEAKMFKSRTMHEKFAVVNDDVFNGSANLNNSSTGKHAEDRFVVKNDEAFSAAFHDEFTRLWDRASWVAGEPGNI